LQPGNEETRESGWKVPPTDDTRDTRLTVVDGMRGDENLRDVSMDGWMY